MKSRTHFVSNSSSTSFCIVGTTVNDEDIEKCECALRPILRENLLSFYREPEGGCCCMGLSIFRMNDDETLREFKERARKSISEILKREIEINDITIIEDAWYE